MVLTLKTYHCSSPWLAVCFSRFLQIACSVGSHCYYNGAYYCIYCCYYSCFGYSSGSCSHICCSHCYCYACYFYNFQSLCILFSRESLLSFPRLLRVVCSFIVVSTSPWFRFSARLVSFCVIQVQFLFMMEFQLSFILFGHFHFAALSLFVCFFIFIASFSSWIIVLTMISILIQAPMGQVAILLLPIALQLLKYSLCRHYEDQACLNTLRVSYTLLQSYLLCFTPCSNVYSRQNCISILQISNLCSFAHF